jgi:filamin
VVLIDTIRQFRVRVDPSDNYCQPTSALDSDELSVIITTPDGQSFLPTIIPETDQQSAGCFLINYVPNQVGDYVITVLWNSIYIPGSPFRVRAYGRRDVSQLIRAYGPGLTHGTIRKVAQFIIDTKNVPFDSPPTGGLSVVIDGPSRALIDCRDNGDGSCSVAYLTTRPGRYTVHVTSDGHHITGSPFTTIMGTGVSLKQIRVYGIDAGQ